MPFMNKMYIYINLSQGKIKTIGLKNSSYNDVYFYKNLD